jgi:hypothetical protein
MVVRALGRLGLGIDLSADCCGLAAWPVLHCGHAAGVHARTNHKHQRRLEGLGQLTGDLELGEVAG